MSFFFRVKVTLSVGASGNMAICYINSSNLKASDIFPFTCMWQEIAPPSVRMATIKWPNNKILKEDV